MGIVGSQGFGGGSSGTFVQENSDWNATTGVPEIFNKPDLSVFTQGVSLGNILFVSSQAPASNNSQTRTQALGRIDRPFRSIQSALNIAESGDIIYIFAGTYNENCSTLNKKIDFILDNAKIQTLLCVNYIAPNNYITGIGDASISNLQGNLQSGFVIVNNLTISNVSSNGGNGIFLKANNCVFTTSLQGGYCVINNCEIFCPINFNGGDINNCTINATHFTDIYSFSNGTIKNCNITFTNSNANICFGNCPAGNLIKFENCNFKANSQNIFNIHLYASNIPNLTFISCYFNCNFIVNTSLNISPKFFNCITNNNYTTGGVVGYYNNSATDTNLIL